MSNQPIIRADHVSMKFNLSTEKFDSFKEYVIKSIKRQISFEEFWAYVENNCRSVKANKRKRNGKWHSCSVD